MKAELALLLATALLSTSLLCPTRARGASPDCLGRKVPRKTA